MEITSPFSTSTPKKTHNVSWSPAMTEFLLEYLTEQTKLGKKGPSGFKVPVLIDASDAINEKFEKNLVFCNLQYHLKSLKKKWVIIQDLKKVEGVSFNPETRELKMVPEMYQKYTEANPSHTQFINKPIANYDKMEIVFGNNEKLIDENLEPKIEHEDDEDSQITTPGEESRKRKRPEPNEEGESSKSEANKKSGHIKWSPIMTEFLLHYLTEEVKLGHKGSSSFKGNALSNAAQAVNHKFGKRMTTYHVQNHLKTLKRRWKTIQKLKNMSGVNFNQEICTLEMDFEEYKKYIEINPLEEQFINKPIKMYAEMEIVCGYENSEENSSNNNTPNINNKKIEGPIDISSPDVNIDAADLGLNVDEMEEIPLLPPANNNNNQDEEKTKKSDQDEENPSNNMEIVEKPLDSKPPAKNMSWNPELSEFVLKFLAEQTRMGNKGSNGFKISVINAAAAAINERFGKRMNFSNVQNHLKTLKRRWRMIQSVKGLEGVVFNHESKMIEMSHEMYQKHVQSIKLNETASSYFEWPSTSSSGSSDDSAPINERFGKRVNFLNVKNHLKTLKEAVEDDSEHEGFGGGGFFHHDRKLIEMSHEMYQKHVQENPGHEQFINTPIELYDEMEIVCSNSNYDNKSALSTPSPSIDLCVIETPESDERETMPIMTIHFSENNKNNNSLIESNNNERNNDGNGDENMVVATNEGTNDGGGNNNNIDINNVGEEDNNDNNVVERSNEGININEDINMNSLAVINEENNNNNDGNDDYNNNYNKSREQKMEKISSIVGQMAEALKELSTEKLVDFAREIMSELRKIEGEFENKTVRLAQRYLVEHTLDGACFLTYNRDEKIAWVKEFIKDHLGGNES